jgi:hypothetical protein
MNYTPAPKINKVEFKCFHCQLMTPRREGKWVDWKTMQVNLCPACEKTTRGRTERVRSTET